MACFLFTRTWRGCVVRRAGGAAFAVEFSGGRPLVNFRGVGRPGRCESVRWSLNRENSTADPSKRTGRVGHPPVVVQVLAFGQTFGVEGARPEGLLWRSKIRSYLIERYPQCFLFYAATLSWIIALSEKLSTLCSRSFGETSQARKINQAP